MKEKQSKFRSGLLKILPAALCLILIVIWIFFGDSFSVDSILKHTPESFCATVIFILFLYAVKSLIIIFPLTALKLAVGIIFPPVTAILVNIAGITVSLSVSYQIGRISGGRLTRKLGKKYPKLKEMTDNNGKKLFAATFFMRAVCILPLDIVSMYLGTTKMKFPKYLTSSLLGVLPSTVAVTLLGASATDPSSPMFWISAILIVGYSVTAALIYRRLESKKKG